MTKRFVVSVASALSIFSLWAEPQWGWTSWTSDQTAATADEGNLVRLSGAVLMSEGNGNAAFADQCGDTSVLVDGTIAFGKVGNHYYSYSIGNNAVLTFSLPGYCNIRAVRLWTRGPDGRVGIAVTSVEGRAKSGEYSTLSSSYDGISGLPRGQYHTAGGGYCFELKNDDESNFATGIEALRINFGQMDNNGTFVSEIEVIGEVSEPRYCTVTFLDREGGELKVLENVAPGTSLEGEAPEPPEVDGWIFVKWDTNFSQVIEDLTVRAIYAKRGAKEWTVETYASATVTKQFANDINLFGMAGVVCELNQGDISPDVKNNNDPSALTNGVIDRRCCIGNGGSLTYTLPYAQDIGALEIYTEWDGGRDGATITSLEYQDAEDAEWKRLDIDEVSEGLNDNSSKGRYAFVATCPDPTMPLMSGVVKVRINFGQMDNKGSGIAEVFARRDMRSAFAWESDWYDATADVELAPADNLMRQAGAAIQVVKQGTTMYGTCTDVSVLTDGVLKATPKNDNDLVGAIYPLGNKAVLDCVFEEPKEIRGLKFWTSFFSDARDGIAVDYLEVKLNGEDFFRVVDTVPAFSKGMFGQNENRPYGLMAGIVAPAGEFMFSKVVALRIHFGNLELNCSTFSEIEVFGRSAAKPFKIIFR